MGVAKVVVNGTTRIDVTQKTVSANNLLSGITALGADGENVTGSIATKSSTDLTASGATVTAPAGYYPTAATKTIIGGSAFTPATTITLTPQVIFMAGEGKLTISVNKSSYVTPTITSGYISQGTSGLITATGSKVYQLDTLSASSYYPSTADQIISDYVYLTGNQTIKSVTTTNLVASNIASGVVVKVGDSANPSRIVQVTGTLTGETADYSVYKNWALNGTSPTFTPLSTEAISIFSELEIINVGAFFHRQFSGSFVFQNVSVIREYAFAHNPYAGTPAPHTFEFPACTVIGSYAFNKMYGLNEVSFPVCSMINANAFLGCGSLSAIYFPECEIIGPSAFNNCTSLTIASFPECKTINNAAFYTCSKLNEIVFPKCSYIGPSAFTSCTSLITATFPSCSTISSYAFQNCTSLQTISFPICSVIMPYAFINCSSLESANFSACKSIGSSAFVNCIGLQSVSFPICDSIGSNAFSNCSSLTKVKFSAASSFKTYIFMNCYALSAAIFGSPSIISCSGFGGTSFFYKCYNLLSLYLLYGSVASLGAALAFASTPISNYTTSTGGVYGSIYVPASLYDVYKSATNWAAYSSRFASLTSAEVSALLADYF